MHKKFEQISIKSSFMKHNGGLLFRELSKNQFEFKTKIKKTHLNTAGITHGGYISSIIDSGAGTAAFRASRSSRCVTISLNINFIASTKLDDEIIGFVKVLKRIFLFLLLLRSVPRNKNSSFWLYNLLIRSDKLEK